MVLLFFQFCFNHFLLKKLKVKIAVIGSGISGLYAAYLLHKEYDITIYEKEQYLGGHTRTLSVEYKNGVNIDVDTGFIVFNEQLVLSGVCV